MCCHRLFIYSTCGHSHLSPTPLILCRHACIPPNLTYSTTCELIAHPYQSWKVESLCPECHARRVRLLAQVEVAQVVKFDEWRWKVSYGMPAHGKDFWGRKAEEREEREEREREGLGREGSKRRKRWSLKRRSGRRKEKECGEEVESSER